MSLYSKLFTVQYSKNNDTNLCMKTNKRIQSIEKHTLYTFNGK